MKTRISVLLYLLALLSLFAAQLVLAADKFKVFVVMSYEEDNPWCQEIKEGIESVLSPVSDISYFYMDTKADFDGGEKKAAAAYALYQQLQPDGVITADDNAQWMFVLPYLMDKVPTPVMFSGVNAEAEKYGFPTQQVSGILERGHVKESIAFLKQLQDSVQGVCFLTRHSPSGEALMRQIDAEKDSYIAQVKGMFLVKSVSEIRRLSATLRSQCDAVYIDSLEGVVDEQGGVLDHQQVFAILEEEYPGPYIGANKYHVEQGALCAVVKTGQEQGETAAEMLLKAMQGTPVSKLAVTRNYRGQRIINVTSMEKLGIRPRPIVLRGASLIRTKDYRSIP